MNAEEHRSTKVFRDYLKIKSVQPEPDYGSIVKFLEEYAKTCEFPCRVHEAVPGFPIVIMTIEGSNPSLPSILLNSHTDVVPVFPDQWKYDPFSATKDEEGNIYARGSQDMKCVGIQHLEAMRELTAEGVRLLRTVHISFVPDEEVGGKKGMKPWCQQEDFKSLNVGFAMDEGLANPGDEMRVFYSERTARWASFVAHGNPGHGSGFIPDTAGYKVQKILGKLLEFRDQQEARLKSDSKLTVGDVNTANITSLKMRVQPNVVPDRLEVGFDIRVTPSEITQVDEMLDSWCSECDVSLEAFHKQNEMGITSTDPEDKWWKAFTTALNNCNVAYTKEIFPAGTDSRYLRQLGLPALGFSPMNHTPILLHDHNEFLNERIFLDGIQTMRAVIESVANVEN
ncbi:aminoacylase-1-like [Watersipora subatra]|uniref:aminoacylase-1-like n=1 Tax=Watersipora subatra TaxID=2589382 RepID=UPI00355C7231